MSNIQIPSTDLACVIKRHYIIDFLCTQLCERGGLSMQNSSNAKKGWEKRRAKKQLEVENNATASIPQSESNAESMQYREEKIRKEIILIYQISRAVCFLILKKIKKPTKHHIRK